MDRKAAVSAESRDAATVAGTSPSFQYFGFGIVIIHHSFFFYFLLLLLLFLIAFFGTFSAKISPLF